MAIAEGSSTPHSLLRRLRDPRNDPAWTDFYARYDPLLRRFCRQINLDPQTSDELCARAWEGLAGKMRTFEYDPGKRFRHWLWIYFRRQALDFLKARRRDRLLLIDFSAEDEMKLLPQWLDRSSGSNLDGIGDEGGTRFDSAERNELLVKAEMAQQAVRKKVKATSWEAYWLVAIEELTFEEAAAKLGMTYLAVYKAVARVRSMLEAQGLKYLGMTDDGTSKG